MTLLNAGNPAFPTNEGDNYDGMTLRDYFAAKAMQSAYFHFSGETAQTKHWTTEGVAESAYAMADAMLKARQKETT
jgi:hypothetical protein